MGLYIGICGCHFNAFVFGYRLYSGIPYNAYWNGGREMSAPQAVRVQTEKEYIAVIEQLALMNFKAFQIGEKFRMCYLTIEDRYKQLAFDSKMLMDNGYETISFEEFIGGQNNG